MEDLREMALEAYDRLIGLELVALVVGCWLTKAPCGGEKAGRSPVDLGKRGIKRSIAGGPRDIPLTIVITPTNRP